MENAKKREKIKDIDGKFDIKKADAACECTGLIQVDLENMDQLENYEDIFTFGQTRV